ncbi:fluoride efflux transporter FluC [Corynebacterium macclintockiae]|uniref:fluoride efflux transporter FluC n=1 Tax=Corynebacterium macclintockiae TaxID=2913501 RepID=UPI003EB92238
MKRLPPVALVFLGGALGAILRWALTIWLPALGDPTGVPGAATQLNAFGFVTLGDAALLLVNVLGALILALLVGLIPRAADPRRAFWGTGVLGGFTSFSSLAAAVVGADVARELFIHDATSSTAPVLIGAAYGVCTLALGLFAAAAGLRLGRDLNTLGSMRRAAVGKAPTDGADIVREARGGGDQ